ncbi:MAG: hypothetical protein M1830_010196 [Pleopsidium flavum]|nr:MAG: hypothetical protein M1830_010196 [Pleopsidium flavum]
MPQAATTAVLIQRPVSTELSISQQRRQEGQSASAIGSASASRQGSSTIINDKAHGLAFNTLDPINMKASYLGTWNVKLRIVLVEAFAFAVFGASVVAAATNTVTQPDERSVSSVFRSSIDSIQSAARSSFASFQQQYLLLGEGGFSFWKMVQILALCSLLPGLWLLRPRRRASNDDVKDSPRPLRAELQGNRSASGSMGDAGSTLEKDREDNDPGLLRKHSTYRSYTTPLASYPSIRTFFRAHPQGDKLPSKPSPLPLLVFIHGLGGSLEQFHPLLTSLVNVSGCLGIDLPGCGLSAFAPSSWKAYSIEALVELLATVIEDHLDKARNQDIVLIAHSMGCSLSALLASSTSRTTLNLQPHVLGLVAICPRATPPSEEQVAGYRKLLSIPNTIFDLWRRWDRRGGAGSSSVARFVGVQADEGTKKLQQRFNEQSKTPVWRRMAWGALPVHGENGLGNRGLPGREVWSGLDISVLLVAGEADTITAPEEVVKIASFLGKSANGGVRNPAGRSDALPASAHPSIAPGLTSLAADASHEKELATEKSKTEILLPVDASDKQSASPTHKRRVLQSNILPAPASHALLYDPATYRTLAGLIQTFLSEHIDERLSLGWQLQLLTTEGKWDVKNLAKWQAVRPVSEPIGGIFRAMKTLREIDDKHSPALFVRDWKGKIKAVVDISHESPVYDPKGLELGGIEYHKFPTVSKIPPTVDEVRDFVRLVERLRASTPSSRDSGQHPLIGVHCHYGFNRTGFFICSYLVEREGFSVQDAIDEFQRQRPPGIRHEHFIDTLFVRYCIGLRRAPTL